MLFHLILIPTPALSIPVFLGKKKNGTEISSDYKAFKRLCHDWNLNLG